MLLQLLGSLSGGKIIPNSTSIQQNPLLQNSWHPLRHTCIHLYTTDVTCCLTLSIAWNSHRKWRRKTLRPQEIAEMEGPPLCNTFPSCSYASWPRFLRKLLLQPANMHFQLL